MSKIQRASLFFRSLLQIAFVLIPLPVLWFWFNAPGSLMSNSAVMHMSLDILPSHISILYPMTAKIKFLGFLISMVPVIFDWLILYFLIRLFNQFYHAVIFSYNNVKAIRWVAFFLMLKQLINVFYQAGLSYFLTMHNPPGYHVVAFSFTGLNLGVLLLALLLLLFAWILAEAVKAYQENQLTV